MKVLLDTCAFLWICGKARELSEEARRTFSDPNNDIFLSSVSAWEIAVKQALGRLSLPSPAGRFVTTSRLQHGIHALSLTEEAALHLERLPSLHRDPFDRMLVCQALVDGMTILTPDSAISQYPAKTIW